jgi:DNA-directed RNA polymerase subunit RPC12/RpoP
MRSHSSVLLPDEAEIHMMKDLEDGRVEVYCTNCGMIAKLPKEISELRKDIQCTNCGFHFVYRPWWEW